MATSGELSREISSGAFDRTFARLYGPGRQQIARQRRRYGEALQNFEAYYGRGRQVTLFSAPGRTELGGNHTDHQNGIALAAAVDLDIIAVASPNGDEIARVKSYGFNKLDIVDLRLKELQPGERAHSASLVRGAAAAMEFFGGRMGGFDAYTASDVLRGSGLSSSAAFEVVIGAILNREYNGGRFSAFEIARMGQYAENIFFGKPSGLLDQAACALGGAICVDFANPEAPQIQRTEMALAREGYSLCITDTGGSHSDLTEEFAAIRAEMESVAHQFRRHVLREVPYAELMDALPRLRAACGDRAVLRALHFYGECSRARAEYSALQKGDFSAFLALVAESGHSSFEYNQNAYCGAHPETQPIPLALAVSQQILGRQGACRLQGGGFAGTIQAFVPQALLEAYRGGMDRIFGAGSCRVLRVRADGCGVVEPS